MNPQFTFRTINYYQAFQKEYSRWHKLHNNPRNENHWAALTDDWGMWVHTTFDLVSPDEYFSTHPEYFSMRNGIRVPDQLCLSNPKVLELTAAALRKKIAEKPQASYWSVSQEDNYSFCQCPACRAIDSAEGSASGTVIRFTNELARQFPDKVISTLAYQYSRKAPLITRPLPNVNIMLCTIECGRALPIDHDRSDGSFAADLASWAKISDNILIWDYVINFHHMINPFPNFHVLAPNIQLFERNGVGMIFEQGYPGKASEFNELRCYMLAKLLWTPDADPDSLMNEFLQGYYGAAAPYIRQYIDHQTKELAKSNQLYIYTPPAQNATDYLSPENLRVYFRIFEQALAAVRGDSITESRVNIAMQGIRYAMLEVSKSLPFTPDWIFEPGSDGSYRVKTPMLELLNDFERIARLSGLRLIHETKGSPQDYKKEMLDYFAHGVVSHKAVGKQLSTLPPCDPRYAATPGSLTDGVHGSKEYRVLWQGWYGEDFTVFINLEKPAEVSKINISCLDNNSSWILLPAAFTVECSPDSLTWVQAISTVNPESGKKINPKIQTFEMSFPKQNAQFLNIHIKSVGDLPAWRGEKGKSWVFVDEIEVY
jgi:hypothetical protein